MDRTGRGRGRRIRGRWTRRLVFVTYDQATPPGNGLTRPCWRPAERLSFSERLRNKFGGAPSLFSCSSLVEPPNCDPVGENNQEGPSNLSFNPTFDAITSLRVILVCGTSVVSVRNQDLPTHVWSEVSSCCNCGIEREVLPQPSSLSIKCPLSRRRKMVFVKP